MGTHDAVRLARAAREWARHDPLAEAQAGLTRLSRQGAGTQWEFLHAPHRVRVAEGGNQSGKSWAGCVDFILQARGLHPMRRWQGPAGSTWRGWYATTTYERFAEQAWGHFKRLLVLPGEAVSVLPTLNVSGIGWDNRNPERPLYLKVRRADGGIAEIWIKSYEQGSGEFQAAEVDALVLDEECPDAIWEEAQPRVLTRRGGIVVTATPVMGVRWLDGLRVAAESGSADVYHCRLDTRDNPRTDLAEIAKLEAVFRGRPELLDLRLRGLPLAAEGTVYSDLVFTPGHVCEPFGLDAEWTRYRAIDHGFRVCACLWFAVDRQGDVVLYREYTGEERTIKENAVAIRRLSGHEGYARTWIDPAVLGRESAEGRRLVDLWHAEQRTAGDRSLVQPALDNEVLAGIEQVWKLLGERGGLQGERPRFRVFRSCTGFLDERRTYRFHDVKQRGDEGPVKPVKRDDHLMDAWRYAVAAGLKHVAISAPPPADGTLGRRLWDARRRAERETAGRL